MVRDDYEAGEKKNRKKHVIKVRKLRILKQYLMGTLFLILLPAGWFYSFIGYFIPLCMIAGIGIFA
jgi:hypothetical protein